VGLEIKHDGFRFICQREGDRLRVFSRRGHDWTDRVPLIAEALRALPVTSVALDGVGLEGIVAKRAIGRTGRDARPTGSKIKNPTAPAATRVIE
jgi:ATP dependent DNA ligase domain